MGTRLYIEAPDSVLESICGAPAGAWERMQVISEMYNELTDASYQKREVEFERAPGTSECYDFRLFGFGKLNSEQWAYLRTVVTDEEDLWGGSSEEPVVIANLLSLCDRKEAVTAWFKRDQITRIYWG
jgi:hypothetical protein